jgi:hypothetical protein
LSPSHSVIGPNQGLAVTEDAAGIPAATVVTAIPVVAEAKAAPVLADIAETQLSTRPSPTSEGAFAKNAKNI